MVFLASWYSLFAWIICSRPDAKQSHVVIIAEGATRTNCMHVCTRCAMRATVAHTRTRRTHGAMFAAVDLFRGVGSHLRVFDVEDLRVLQHHVVNFRLKAQFRDLSA